MKKEIKKIIVLVLGIAFFLPLLDIISTAYKELLLQNLIF